MTIVDLGSSFEITLFKNFRNNSIQIAKILQCLSNWIYAQKVGNCKQLSIIYLLV